MSFTLHQFLTQLIQVLSSERERECPMWTTSVPLYAMFQLENYSFFFCRTSQLAFPCFTNLIKTTLQQTTFKPNQLCGFRGFFSIIIFPLNKHLLLSLFHVLSIFFHLFLLSQILLPLLQQNFLHSTVLEEHCQKLLSEVVHLYLFLNKLELFFFCSYPLSAYVPESYQHKPHTKGTNMYGCSILLSVSQTEAQITQKLAFCLYHQGAETLRGYSS